MEQALAELDLNVGKLRIEVSDPQMQVRLDGKLGEGPDPWREARVEPGTYTISGEKDGAPPVTLVVAVKAGEAQTARLEQPTLPVAPLSAPVRTPDPPHAPAPHATAPRAPASRVTTSLSHAGQPGVFTRLDIEGQGRGAVGTFGISYGIGNHLEIQAAAMIGREKGVEPGATMFILSGSWKPRISLGVPIFIDKGAWPGVHPGAGIEWDPLRHFGLFAEVGAVLFPRAPAGYENIVFLPATGAQARF